MSDRGITPRAHLTQEAALSFFFPLLHGSESSQDGVPEDRVCFVEPVWVADSRFPGTVVALRTGSCSPHAQAPQAVHGFRSPVPSPPYKDEDCSRGLRTLADVLDALM